MRVAPREAHGPASETDRESWCIDCGHHKNLHKDGPLRCAYWTAGPEATDA